MKRILCALRFCLIGTPWTWRSVWTVDKEMVDQTYLSRQCPRCGRIEEIV